MFLNEVLAARRKDKRLTQSELSESICTQATISKMENNGIVPTTEILVKLCMRLDLTLDDVFSEFSETYSATEKISKQFEKIEYLMSVYEPEKVAPILDSIHVKDLMTAQERATYFYYLGDFTLLVKHDIDSARYYLQRVLDETLNIRSSIFPAIAYSTMGVSYAMQSQNEKAEYYFGQSLDNVRKQSVEKNSKQDKIIQVYANAARYYSNADSFEKSNQLILECIEKFVEKKLFPKVESLFYDLGFNYHKQHIDEEQTESALQYSSVFAHLNENKMVLDHIGLLKSQKLNKFKMTKDDGDE
jgi:transcriptional regulator with XRE-family HTH domain